jgi:hypothetical protein
MMCDVMFEKILVPETPFLGEPRFAKNAIQILGIKERRIIGVVE